MRSLGRTAWARGWPADMKRRRPNHDRATVPGTRFGSLRPEFGPRIRPGAGSFLVFDRFGSVVASRISAQTSRCPPRGRMVQYPHPERGIARRDRRRRTCSGPPALARTSSHAAIVARRVSADPRCGSISAAARGGSLLACRSSRRTAPGLPSCRVVPADRPTGSRPPTHPGRIVPDGLSFPAFVGEMAPIDHRRDHW